ncbi:hypothetical protein F5876DRAFT_85157 [Lentinula aff. lateritia]|uniref:Uncharacterized protein n=1 Tax=Lentinula aff. lateritia TaxID=2804960 RepID=A0ACC1TFV1_9AGAR|nr:hypothetical protein F5876DRAFT_85157 [Lentinula aff. lateritia]
MDSNNAGERGSYIPSSSEEPIQLSSHVDKRDGVPKPLGSNDKAYTETTGGIEIDTTNSVSSDTEILKKRKRYFPKPPNPEILKRHGQSQWDKVEENWEEEERAEYEYDPEADDNEENDEDDEDDEKDEEDEATTNSCYATTVLENEPTSGQSHSISRPVSHLVSRSVSHPVSHNASQAASHLPTRPPTRPVSPALPVPVPSTTGSFIIFDFNYQ